MACRWATDIRADTENAESKLLTGAGPGVFDGVCPRNGGAQLGQAGYVLERPVEADGIHLARPVP